VWGSGEAEKIVTQGDCEGIEYRYAVSWVKSTPATRDVAGDTAATRARLEAAGWTITSVDPPLDEADMVGANPADRAEGFAAERGALALHFNDYLYPGAPWYDGDGNATYSIWHQQPWWLTGFAWLGGLLAAALGWLLTGWMSRRPGAGHGRGPAAGSGPRQRYARRGRRRAREATPLDRCDGRRPAAARPYQPVPPEKPLDGSRRPVKFAR
jgi:hypothetical protein